jgi:hypothetical protein
VRDLKGRTVLTVKALLFVVIGVAASAILLLRHPSVQTALLLALAVWAVARAYYFAFYVIERYIDGAYRYSGLLSAVRWVWRSRRG